MSIKFRDVLNNKLKDPEFKKEFDAIEPEFSMIRALIAARKEKGLTQLELAEKVKISPTYMSEIELGKSNFGVETLIRISEELQVSTDWLIRAAVPEVNAIYQNEIHSIIKDCEPALIEYMLQMLQLMKKTSEKTGKDE